MSDWIGRTLSKVEVREMIGRGGMAEVYLGRHTTLNRPVAVKILHSHLTEDEIQLSRFRSEAQAVAGLRHPNIVQVYDFDIADSDRPYMVMELLEGPALKEHLEGIRRKETALRPQTIMRLVDGIASALDYAHERDIIHRDIKPANVVLRAESTAEIPTGEPLPADIEPILTDFGIARMANADVQTASGTVIGTPAYMSPEQVRGETIDHRTDIYALGIMLYEMISGKLPFDGETQASLLIKQMTEPPPPLSDVNPYLQEVVDRALAKQPGQRYQSAGELAKDLRRAFEEDPDAVLPAPGTTGQRGSTGEADTVRLMDGAEETAEPQTVAGEQTSTIEAGRSRLPMWIIGGVGVLALIVAVVALIVVFGRDGSQVAEEDTPVPAETSVPTRAVEEGGGESEAEEAEETEVPEVTATPLPESTTPTIDPTVPRGTVQFRNDVFNAQLVDLEPAPEGMIYEAWLVSEEAAPLSLGAVNVTEGQATVSYTDPNRQTLLEIYSGFVLSVEPEGDADAAMSDQIAYTATISDDVLSHIRTLYEYTLRRDEPFRVQLLEGAKRQAGQYTSHLGFSVDAISGGDLGGGKVHAEHVINIIVGANSEAFADWNQDGLTQNPGDDVGLEPYLLLLQDALRTVVLTAEDEETQNTAQDLLERTGEILLTVQDAQRIVERITATDQLEEARPLATELDTMRVESAVAALADEASELQLSIGTEVFADAP